MTQFDKLLIANRGEIAARVARGARALGYRTVAIYSDADVDALHVTACDEAVRVGPAPVGESYLDPARVLQAARISGAGAVHPGYGFLSENAAFARACGEAGLVFVGPPADAIDLMGDKRRAKIAMQKAGVPCVPGYEGESQDDEVLLREASRIGYPVMIKAAAGGGGRGMRLAEGEQDLLAQVSVARAEAENAFGNGQLILERALMGPRHVEIQVFADSHGGVIHLGERDCSVQRRYQKVVEESPSPAVNSELRAGMGEAAVAAARACNYQGAGTVEFLLDRSGEFFFLEMNTRLQVEHPVTEMVTGQDLVALQLRVAAGEKLPLTQADVKLTGHAIEIRLYAEDTRRGFLPQTGMVQLWRPATAEGCRIDHGLREGVAISPHYDSMVAKLIAHGRDRPEALRRVRRLLDDTSLLGVTSNASLLQSVLGHPGFVAGEADIRFIEQHLADDPSLSPAPAPAPVVALAAALQHALTEGAGAPADGLSSWHSTAPPSWPRLLSEGEYEHPLLVCAAGPGLPLRVEVSRTASAGAGEDAGAKEASGEDLAVTLIALGKDQVTFEYQQLRQRARFVFDGRTLFLDSSWGQHRFEDITRLPRAVDEEAGSGRLLAPMDGAVVRVDVGPGDPVSQGQTVVIVEAMKMQHRIQSDVDGEVSAVHVAQGDQVQLRQLLVEVQPSEASEV